MAFAASEQTDDRHVLPVALKVLIAGVLPEGKRNTAFGLYYIGYGGGWLIGSIATGLLYDQSRVALVVFVVVAQLASLPLFLIAKQQEQPAG